MFNLMLHATRLFSDDNHRLLAIQPYLDSKMVEITDASIFDMSVHLTCSTLHYSQKSRPTTFT